MQVQKIAIDRAIALLQAAGCKFAIVDADGGKYGDLLIAEAPKRHRGAFPRGTLVAHFLPHIKDIQPGMAAVVPYGPCAAEKAHRNALQKAIASHCSAAWGHKTYITHMNDAGVEILRVQ